MNEVMPYQPPKRTEDRNAQIYTAYLFGATKQDLAEKFGLGLKTVSNICRKVEVTAPERTRVVLNDRLTEAGLMLLSQARELFEKPAPPITSGKDGEIVYDPDTGEAARDYSAKIKAGQFMLQVIDRLSKLTGADMPVQYAVTVAAETAAIEQAERVTGQFHHLRVVS